MNKLIRNWSYLLASDVTQQVIGFVVVIILARKLTPEGFGQYNVILSIAAIFSVISNFGTNSVVIREVSIRPEGTAQLLRNILIPIKSFTLLIAVILYYLYSKFISPDNYVGPWFVLIIILNLTLWDSTESISFGHQVTKFSAILNILFAITWFSIIVLLPGAFITVRNIVLVYCSLHFIKALAYVIIVYKQFYLPSIREVVQYGLKKISFIKMSATYFWLLSITTFAQQLPVQFLNSNSNLEEVAFYSVGNKLMVPIGIAVGTAFKTFFPFMIKLYNTNKAEFLEKMRLGFGLILTFGTILAFILSITSKYWLVLLFGKGYEASISVFNFLVWFSIISILDTLLSNALSSSYKERALAILATIDILIILPLIYVGSLYGAYGLSLLKMISGIVILSFHWIVFVRLLKVDFRRKEILLLFSFFIMSMIISLLNLVVGWKLLMFLGLMAVMSTINNSPIISSFFQLGELIKGRNIPIR